MIRRSRSPDRSERGYRRPYPHNSRASEYNSPRERNYEYTGKPNHNYRKDFNEPSHSKNDRRENHLVTKEHYVKDVRGHKRGISPNPISGDEKLDLIPKTPPPPHFHSNANNAPPEDRLSRLEKLVEILVTQNSHNTQDRSVENPANFEGFPEFIPRNHNFTTSMWINCIEEESIRQNLDERQTILFTESKMTGVVKAWYNSLSHFGYSWPELKLLILKTFPDNRDFAETLELLVTRKKLHNESWTNYFFSKLYLVEACKITGVNAVSCIIHGFNDQRLQQEASNYNFLNPEALYSSYLIKLQEYEQHQPETIENTSNYDFPPRSNNITSNEDCRRRIEKKKKNFRR